MGSEMCIRDREIQRLAHEQGEILAAQDRVLAQQTEMLTLLRWHTARPEEAARADVNGAVWLDPAVR